MFREREREMEAELSKGRQTGLIYSFPTGVRPEEGTQNLPKIPMRELSPLRRHFGTDAGILTFRTEHAKTGQLGGVGRLG